MEGFLINITFSFALIACGLLLVAFFSFHRQPSRCLVVGFWTIGTHLVYKLLWAALAGQGQYEIPAPFGLVYPALLYLFAYTHYLPGRRLKYRDAAYLALPLFIHIVFYTIVSLRPASDSWVTGYSISYYGSCVLALLSGAIYTALLYRNRSGAVTPIDMLIRQLTMICVGLAVLMAVVLYETAFEEREPGFEVRPMVYIFLTLGLALVARYLAKGSARRSQITSSQDSLAPGVEVSTGEGQAENELAATIEQELKDAGLYLNPSVSLDMLADRTGIPRHQLTQLFSSHYNMSFYQFIASIRIEYAISRVLEMERTATMDSLSYACGFNSKTSFNRYFKVYTGMTPSEYRCAHDELRKRSLTPEH